MQLARIDWNGLPWAALIESDTAIPLRDSAGAPASLDELLFAADVADAVAQCEKQKAISFSDIHWLPPIDDQEVWAAGVTYKRSQTARMEESEAAKDCYDRVYQSDRPEIFFKATPSRCSGHLGPLRIRTDSKWNVPEPELALAIRPDGKIVGYTIGNDMSSRDIEGENPLYLPQAKFYNLCCGLGPWVTLADAMPERSTIDIDLKIYRESNLIFEGNTSVSEMARNLEDLVAWLIRDNDMPSGAFLLTGTGIVPNNDFTLLPNDQVLIEITAIGTLANTIIQG